MDWKKVFWFKNGKRFTGMAVINYILNRISLEDKKGRVFEILEAEQVKNGMSLQEIYNAIPFNITDYELGGRS